VDRVIQKEQLRYPCCVAVYYVEDTLVEHLNVTLETKYPLKCIKRKTTQNKILGSIFTRNPRFHYQTQTDIVLLLRY